MIVISTIMGEGFDLLNGKEIERGLVLTNGVSTRTVSVSNEVIMAILELASEEKGVLPSTIPDSKPEPELEGFRMGDVDPSMVDDLTGVGSL